MVSQPEVADDHPHQIEPDLDLSDACARHLDVIAAAKGSSKLSPAQRMFTLIGLMAEALRHDGTQIKASRIFRAAGYQNGRTFWASLLAEPIPIGLLVQAIAVVIAASLARRSPLERRQARLNATNHLFDRLHVAAELKEPWFLSEVAPLLSGGPARGSVRVDPAAAVAWLHHNPLAREFLPLSLRSYLKETASETEQSPPPPMANADQSPGGDIPGSPPKRARLSEAMLREYMTRIAPSSGPAPAPDLLHPKIVDAFPNQNVTRSMVRNTCRAIYGDQRPGRRRKPPQ